jgi:type VI secretion system FHA domain protein
MDFMKLIFKIINNPSCGNPSERQKVFDARFSTIGRSVSSDWVLPDPDRFISSKHAEIILRDNQFFLKDISSNGTINGLTDEAIGNNQELIISDGQTFLVGEYLIQAEIEGISDQCLHQPIQSIASDNADWDNQMDDFWGNSSDPLDLLAPNRESSAVSAARENIPSLADSLERTPAFKQAMSFTNTSEIEADRTPAAQPETSSGIPENWDNTSFSFPEPEVKPTPTPAPIAGIGDIADDDFFSGLVEDVFLNKEIPQAENLNPVKLERPPSSRPRKRQQKENNVSTAQKSNNNLLEVARIAFEKQGYNKELLTEDVATQWLSLMPTVMQSTIELLQARAAIKNEFRVSKTLLTTSENNPLKFSTNAEDAINSLFHQKRPGFLNSDLAFKQAFKDINLHQTALLHGVRVAMMDLLKQFDADFLEDSFTKSNKNKGLLDKFSSIKSSQAKLWQQYKELYKSEYKVDSDDGFQRIFGETFAQAYDEFSTNN